MTDKEELELILRLIKKHGLPLSPIMEYSIQERLSFFQEESDFVSDRLGCKERSFHKEKTPLSGKHSINHSASISAHSTDIKKGSPQGSLQRSYIS